MTISRHVRFQQAYARLYDTAARRPAETPLVASNPVYRQPVLLHRHGLLLVDDPEARVRLRPDGVLEDGTTRATPR